MRPVWMLQDSVMAERIGPDQYEVCELMGIGRMCRLWLPRQSPATIGQAAHGDVISPGVTTHREVLELAGHDVEERQSLTEPNARTLVYRGRRIVPHHKRLAGVLATVTHWDVEDHEVEIVVESDVVRDVRAHVKRSRLTGAEPV